MFPMRRGWASLADTDGSSHIADRRLADRGELGRPYWKGKSDGGRVEIIVTGFWWPPERSL